MVANASPPTTNCFVKIPITARPSTLLFNRSETPIAQNRENGDMRTAYRGALLG